MTSPKRPNAFSLPELIIALTLLGSATAVMMPLLLTVSNQRRASEQRQYALVQAENLLDAFLAVPWSDTTQDRLQQRLKELGKSNPLDLPTLPALEQSVTVTDHPGDSSRQIAIELRWRNHAGQLAAPVRLSVWKFAPKEVQP